jgi:hypothetical protein
MPMAANPRQEVTQLGSSLGFLSVTRSWLARVIGKSTQTVVPSPTLLVARIVAPSPFTMDWQSVKPTPVPSWALLHRRDI